MTRHLIILLVFAHASLSFPTGRTAQRIDDAIVPTSSPSDVSMMDMAAIDQELKLRVQAFLERNGYLPLQIFYGPHQQASDENLSAGIADFQEFINLPRTGQLDDRTLGLIFADRCGVPDIVSTFPQPFWARWHKHELTYRIVGRPVNIDEEMVRDSVREAMELWMAATPLLLCEQTDPSANADINIRHVTREHGDGVPFDGRGGTLGHAFLPTVGEVHLDLDEHWISSNGLTQNNGTDYLSVMAHEIGHALGMLHSGVEGSVMFPFYTNMHNVTLIPEDVALIQTLYGPPHIDVGDVRERCPRRPSAQSSTSLSSRPQVTTSSSSSSSSTSSPSSPSSSSSAAAAASASSSSFSSPSSLPSTTLPL